MKLFYLMVSFIKELFLYFFKSNSFQKGAGLAYYAVFSFIPIIIIVTSIVGIIFGEKAVAGEIYTQLKNTLGDSAALQIEQLIKDHHINHNSIVTTIIGFMTLTLSASGMFIQIHNSLNTIWNIQLKPGNGLIIYFSKHLGSFLLLILLFFLLFSTTLINSYLMSFQNQLGSNFSSLYLYEHLVSFLILSAIFTLIFRFLGDAIIQYKPSLFGGTLTALLFTFGKVGIGLYIKHSNLSSTFGSASLLAIIMLWVYYTSQIMFLGASFIAVFSKRTGHPVLPKKNARLVTQSR